MNTLKHIAATVLFCAALILSLVPLSRLFSPKDNTAEAGMDQPIANGFLGEPDNSIDVLVLGDSEAYSSVIPLEIWERSGYTAYVCGTSSQKLPNSYTLLSRALQSQRPRIVILESLAIYRSISPGDMLLNGLSRLFPVFRYHDRWKSLQQSDLSAPLRPSYRHDDKGHWLNLSTVPGSQAPYMIPTDDAQEIPAVNRAYVRAIKELCDRNGATLLLLSVPSCVNWDYGCHNGIQGLADALGCPYIDLNLETERLAIDWETDTWDKGDHLNHSGAVKVSAFLAEYLEGTGLFQDHRQDQAYAARNESLTAYRSKLQREREQLLLSSRIV